MRARRHGASDGGGFGGGDVAAEDLRAAGGPNAARENQVLERDGDAVERAERPTGHHRGFGGLGRGERGLVGDRDVGLELAVEPRDAIEVRLHHLDG